MLSGFPAGERHAGLRSSSLSSRSPPETGPDPFVIDGVNLANGSAGLGQMALISAAFHPIELEFQFVPRQQFFSEVAHRARTRDLNADFQ
jgi:hypothetical protein